MIIKILSNYKKWLNKKKCSLKIGACENSNSFMMLLSFSEKQDFIRLNYKLKINILVYKFYTLAK